MPVIQPYTCKVCGKLLKSDLKQHMRIHTNEKPFECSTCQRRFTQKSQLIQHERIHTGETPYQCKFCDAKFKQQSNLNQHERTHKGQPRYGKVVKSQSKTSIVSISSFQPSYLSNLKTEILDQDMKENVIEGALKEGLMPNKQLEAILLRKNQEVPKMEDADVAADSLESLEIESNSSTRSFKTSIVSFTGTFQLQEPFQGAQIVTSRSNFTKTVIIEETSAARFNYPHADNQASIVIPSNPKDMPQNLKDAYVNVVVDQLEKLVGESRSLEGSVKKLWLMDSILMGLNEDVLENCRVLRMEFPFLPSWLPWIVFKNRKFDQFFSKIETIYYSLGYDLLRCYKYSKTQEIVDLMDSKVSKFIETIMVPVAEEKEKPNSLKNFVFITIPEIGILSDTIRAFNKGMKEKLLALSKRVRSKINISIIDWALLIPKDEQNGFLQEPHCFDDRLLVLIKELMRSHGVKTHRRHLL